MAKDLHVFRPIVPTGTLNHKVISMRLREMLESGMSLEEIHTQLPESVSFQYFSRYCKEHQIVQNPLTIDGFNLNIWCKLFIPRRSFLSLTPQCIIEELRRQIEIERKSVADICQLLHISVSTVRVVCRTHHITTKKEN